LLSLHCFAVVCRENVAVVDLGTGVKYPKPLRNFLMSQITSCTYIAENCFMFVFRIVSVKCIILSVISGMRVDCRMCQLEDSKIFHIFVFEESLWYYHCVPNGKHHCLL